MQTLSSSRTPQSSLSTSPPAGSYLSDTDTPWSHRTCRERLSQWTPQCSLTGPCIPHTHKLPLSVPWPVPVMGELLPFFPSPHVFTGALLRKPQNKATLQIYPLIPPSFPLLTIRTSNQDYFKVFQDRYCLQVCSLQPKEHRNGCECSKQHPITSCFLLSNLINTGNQSVGRPLHWHWLSRVWVPPLLQSWFPASSFLYSIQDTLGYSLISAIPILWWPPCLCWCFSFDLEGQDYLFKFY